MIKGNGCSLWAYMRSFVGLLITLAIDQVLILDLVQQCVLYMCFRFGASRLTHMRKFELCSPSEKGLVAKSRNMAGCSEASIAFTFNFHNRHLQ